MRTAAVNTFFLIDNHLVQGGNYDPSAATAENPLGTDGKAGSLFIQVGNVGTAAPFACWQKQDDGVSLNWILFGSGGGGGVTTVGAIDTPAKSADGAHITGTTIFFQTADGGFPGMLSLTSQNIVGDKSFSQPIHGFSQANVAPVVAGGTATLFADDIILGTPVPGTNIWRQVDASGNVRVLNGIVQDTGVDVVTAPQFINFIGATVVASGLGVDVTVGASGATPERETAPGGLTASQIGTGAPVLGDGVILGFIADHNTVIANLQGSGLLFEGALFDYTLDDLINPGFTTIVFSAALVPFLIVGQNFQVQYSH